MGLLYLITIILLIVAFLMLHKTDEKLNILQWIAISIVCLLCYNVLIVYILNTFNILSKLSTLSVINIFFLFIIFFNILKTKKIQKYYIRVRELISIILIILIVIAIALKYFGLPFDLKYIMTDAGIHYSAALNFYDKSDLLNHAEDQFFNFNTMMPGAYVNTGLLFKTFENMVDRINFYKIFIIFDIFLFSLSAIMMYAGLSKFTKSWSMYICAFVVALIYALGYPLNSMLFGFPYLSLGVIIISCIIILMEYFKEGIIKKEQLVLLLFLLTFGLFFSYYLFVPVVYGAIFIYFCIDSYKKNKSIFNKNNIINIIIILVLPGIFGIVYHILPNLIETGPEYVNNALQYGYIYRNFYSNFLLFLPIAIIGFWKEKNIFNKLILVFLIAFIAGIYVVVKTKIEIDLYYLFKNYFVLWFIVIYMFFKGLVFIETKRKSIPIFFLIIYVAMLISAVIRLDVKIEQTRINKNEKLTTVMDIFCANNTLIKNEVPVYNQSELEIMRYMSNNIDFEKNVVILGMPIQIFWVYSIFDYTSIEEGILQEQVCYVKSLYKDEEYDYIVYFNKVMRIFNEEETQKIFKDMEHIIKNESGGVLKRVNI